MDTPANNHMTLDDLAAMISQGFKSTASKEDIERAEQIQREMLEELTATHADVRYLRGSMDILTRNEAERNALGLVACVWRLEQKAGLAT
jgi:hypothetical protein